LFIFLKWLQGTETMKIANLTIAAALGLPVYSARGGGHLLLCTCPSGHPAPACANRPRRFFTQKKLAALTVGLFLAGVPGLARAEASFTFTTIDVPGSTGTDANGNSTHAIAGDFTDTGGITHGFVLSRSRFTTIDVPGAAVSSVNGINAIGQLAGTYQDTVRFHAFFSGNGSSFTTLDPPGSIRSQGGFINARGEAVGTYRSSDNKRHGFTWRNGVYTNLLINVPGDDPVLGTVALGINDRGQVVGDYVDAAQGNRRGFLLSHGVYTTLDVPGALLTVAEGIDDEGVIVGLFIDAAAGNEHGFILRRGVYATIDVPKAGGTGVYSINAKGEIVGSYCDGSGCSTNVNPSNHGFLGTPDDEAKGVASNRAGTPSHVIRSRPEIPGRAGG
jgi:uncharacterized membrane protein